MTTHHRILASILFTLLGGACAQTPETGLEDGEHDVGLAAGKADGTGWNECELREMVAFVNDASTTSDTLKIAGVASRARTNLIAGRPFADAQAIDDVAYVGPVTFQQLVDAIGDRCDVPPPSDDVAAIFSPQAYESSHLVRVASEIDRATRSVDVAMYSFSDAQIMSALERAVDRGVTIRMIFDPASAERTMPAGTRSQKLEQAGIEVRYVNKVMHHKFAIIDGARLSADAANDAMLISGSGNWSSSAGTKYDENTIFLRGNAELNLRFQREFNYLWANGRPFPGEEGLPQHEAIEITDAMIAAVEDSTVDARFTSANFRTSVSATYGPTFSVVAGRNEVSNRLVELIQGARRSIHLASGHLRSRPVVLALEAARAANPSLDIKVYLDQQEYLAASTHTGQVRDRDACIAAATTEARRQACYDRDFLYSYQLHQAGIAVRFKTYAYRWDYAYAAQMHHKYIVIDGEIVITGSYNLSDNAEHATMENIMVFQGSQYAALAAAFEANFASMWITGEAQNRYMRTMDNVRAGSGFPIVFDSMALTWDQVTELKRAMRTACPAVDSPEFRTDPAGHRYCNP
jgi:phosphatidylserine/phosphatidylglycerophosphate/cardiolipin synthase-like enzyme